MSGPSRPVRGFVPIGDAAGTLPGVVPRGRAMSAQTRHHFTTLRQVNQLIEASEADADLRQILVHLTPAFSTTFDDPFYTVGLAFGIPAGRSQSLVPIHARPPQTRRVGSFLCVRRNL